MYLSSLNKMAEDGKITDDKKSLAPPLISIKHNRKELIVGLNEDPDVCCTVNSNKRKNFPHTTSTSFSLV